MEITQEAVCKCKKLGGLLLHFQYSYTADLSNKAFQVIAVAFLVIFFQPLILQAKENNTNSVTLTARNKTFSEIVDQLSEKLDYTIIFDDSLAHFSINGEFKNIELDDFFYRVLRNNNISVITDTFNSTVYVRNFGNKNEHMLYQSDIPLFSKNRAINKYSEKSFSELHSIAAMQEENRIKRLNGNGTYSPMTPLTPNEYKKMMVLQGKNRTNRLNDPSYLYPNTDTTIGEILKAIDTQETRRIERLNNKNAINPTTGKKQSTIIKITTAQEKNREKRIKSKEEKLPTMETLSFSRLSQILKQQELNRKKRLGI